MNKPKNKYNDKYQHHGYQEWYYEGTMWLRGNFKNGEPIGYKETNTIPFMLADEFSYKRTLFHIR